MIKFSCPHCKAALELEFTPSVAEAMGNQDWRRVTLKELELSTRAHNRLRNEGVQTAGEIDDKTDTELLCWPNFGRRSLWEVRKRIEQLKGPAQGSAA